MNKNLETIQPGEEQITRDIVNAIVNGQKAKYKSGTTARRALHAKSHGTVNASFRIFDNLPEEYRVGLFATPATYEALVRFSNGAFGLVPDIPPNVRGLAIKLLNVPGEKLLPGEETPAVLHAPANHPTSSFQNWEQGALFMQGKLKEIAKTAPGVIRRSAVSIFKSVKNPLTFDYSSQVAYLCGERAVKYHLQPSEVVAFILQIPDPFDSDVTCPSNRKDFAARRSEVHVVFHSATYFTSGLRGRWKHSLERSSIPIGELTILQTHRILSSSRDGDGNLNPLRVLKEHRRLVGPAECVLRFLSTADYKWRSEANATSGNRQNYDVVRIRKFPPRGATTKPLERDSVSTRPTIQTGPTLKKLLPTSPCSTTNETKTAEENPNYRFKKRPSAVIKPHSVNPHLTPPPPTHILAEQPTASAVHQPGP